MIGLQALYALAGTAFALFALSGLRDATNPLRLGNAAFWGLLALSFWAGDVLGDVANGLLVLALVGIAGARLLGRGTPRERVAEPRGERLGNRLFIPALVIPATALIGTLAYNYTPLKTAGLIEDKWATLVFLATGVILALILCFAWLRPSPVAPVEEGRRLIDSIGWAAVLPQMLAALGAVFAAAGVGTAIGEIAGAAIPTGSVLLAVVVYALGMALFTMIMGNAFAAFPVMSLAIGVPILIHADGGNPAVIAAVGMLSGFCGTLMTPMAANFNIVPAALLELKDQYAVIRKQVGTALPLLACNIAILYFAGFR
ncbi:DUF979 domain-containing protein [Novosphingobium tardum]|uniref:DUF979 domain-containing protein n=1 Tax=Novosphingobium tardum TaxID=1538021 RepID=A0ABV8RST9_9SPHN